MHAKGQNGKGQHGKGKGWITKQMKSSEKKWGVIIFFPYTSLGGKKASTLKNYYLENELF